MSAPGCRPAALLLLAVAAGAPDPAVDELVRELRADRLARRSSTDASARQSAREVMAATVSPIQAALTQLLEQQDQLTQRQAQLAAELREWTMLAVDSQQKEQAARAAELSRRLSELESSLAEQAARHGEVEQLMSAALQQASTRLQELLLRLGAAPASRGGSEGQPETGEAGAVQAPEPARGAAGEANGGGRDEERQASLWPMWGVAVFAFGTGAWLLSPRRAQAPGGWSPSRGRDPEQGPSEAAADPEHVDVLGEGAADPGIHTSPEPARRAAIEAPRRTSCRLQVGSSNAAHEIRALLARDPRVLARPEPELTRDGDAWLVAYAMLPGLPRGERARLEQRLRDIAR